MDISLRIKELRNKKKLGSGAFADLIKVDRSQYSKLESGKLAPTVSQIMEISSIFNVSIDWLLKGEKVVIKDVDSSIKDYVPLIPIAAMAGFANGDTQVMDYEIEKLYKIPDFENKGVKYLIRASGSSMYPKYSNGDILACRPIKDKSFFQWGKVYVLDTDQGPLVKRLFPCPDDDACLECHSDNKESYPPFKISKKSIRSVSIVIGVVRLE